MDLRRDQRSLLVLDFDGVICDSLEECFVASWHALHGQRGETAREPAASSRARFRELRPFVRSGEDFVMIQALMARGAAVASQREFDLLWDLPGAPDRRELQERFYAARAELRQRDTERWLAMNPVYAHVPGALARLSRGVPLYVLSTKRSEYVIPIIEAHRLPVPSQRVLDSRGGSKLSIVEDLRVKTGREVAIFVEDQVDSIRGNDNRRLRPFLAAWGYVRPEWLEDPEVRVLGAREFEQMVAALR